MKAPTATHRGFEFRGFSLLGKTYGRLTVTKCLGHPPGQKQTIWECKCSCGRKTAIRGGNLKAGNTRSCGCLKYEPPGHPDKRDFSRAIALRPEPPKGVSNVDTLSRAFEFEGFKVRVAGTSDAPFFVAADVCGVLGISKYRDALRNLDEDERVSMNVDTLGGRQKMTGVTESGLYALIFTSRKAQAKAFRRWVTGEVLPEIRRTGQFLGKRKAKKLPAAASEPGWVEQRADGISTRKELCSTLRACGITEREPYWTATNAAYRAVTGKDAKELKKALGLKKSASLRDCLDAAALNAVAFAEHLASLKIEEAGAKGEEALRVALDILARLGQLVLPSAPEKPKELVDEAVAMAAFARMKAILG